MFDHVTIRVSDAEAGERFYATLLPLLGIEQSGRAGEFGEGCAEFAEWGDFSIAADGPATTGLHVGFCAWSRDDVDRFWRTGVDAGYRSDGEPGPRPQYLDDYYGAFLLDPDGNSVEAVHHGEMVRKGNIDHLWIRVDDLDATARFYDDLSDHTGFHRANSHPGRVHFDGDGSSFALVAGSPVTQNLHIAFGATSNATVDAFHAAALAAGHRDNGGPGERAQYHAGYYGAFIIDPAGTNVEVVNHNRA